MVTYQKPPCSNCGKTVTSGGWALNGYHGLKGYYCGKCYDLVSHDSYGNPNYPNEYLMILLKQGGAPVGTATSYSN